MRRLAALLSLLAVTACEQMLDSMADAGAGDDAGTSAPDASVPCEGFPDKEGRCGDLTCLATNTCDTRNAAEICAAGQNGPGTCFHGRCAYVNTAQACNSGAECPCGLCGTDGRCYEDRQGSCGLCESDDPVSSAPKLPACTACLSDCRGVGPSCCAGCGCVCEGVCGICH
jgi:hypothetical protein